MSRKNITTLKGWAIARIDFSAGYYTLTLTKGTSIKTIQVDADQIFDGDGMRFVNNV